ncbi:BZIP transcription factor [Colletotrichum higginsianum IMI 349063]|uniref:BZIP transcription factor n=2 Tax=Colletotrichum higginsianum (strain IMI 349063) TaxID=759273 RepID=A0A1B7Y796_COLHI|nr:BZIP transcription factor [Colletotrichum higginsianum IMI 349063]OBR07880.1 BZIP transcription factor [Colletotrichum higginsianum IMI 349063]
MAHTAVANTRTRPVSSTVVTQQDKYAIDNMTRSASAEPTKPTKRKGTRSVSTLTPSQLARKRANDREAQRAIRARTKEHIERLERELEELKSERGRDQSQTVQELLRKNKALEEELFKLRESMGVPNGQSYPNSVYDDNLSSISGAVPSPRSSPFPSNGDYNVMQELGPSYVPMPDASESWGPGIPVSVPSTVSSPSSSANTDEYGAGYIPTSVPAPMMDARSIPAKMDYDDVDSGGWSPLHAVVGLQRNSETLTTQSLDAGYPHNHSMGTHVSSSVVSSSPAVVELISNSGVLSTTVGSLIRQPGTALWEIPTLIVPPTCRIDQLLVGFIQDCRRLAQLKPLDTLLRPARVNVKNFLEYHPASPTTEPPRCQLADLDRAASSTVTGPGVNHPIAELITALVNKGGVTNVIERLAVFAVIQRAVAWLVHPTREAYAAIMPELTPKPCQNSIPHPQWVDLVLWPPLRTTIIERQEVYANEEFQSVYSASLRLINWPCRPIDALVVDPQSGEMWLSDTFTAHAMRVENWRLNENFVRRYPELRGCVAVEGS